MTSAEHLWRPLRVVLGAAGLALCWFLLAPSSAQADEAPKSPLGGLTAVVEDTVDTATTPAVSTTKAATKSVAKTSTKATSTVTHTVAETTDTVDDVVASTPVAPVASPVVSVVTKTTKTVTKQAATTVDTVVTTTSEQVSEVVDRTVGTTTTVLEDVVDLVTAPVEAVTPVVPVPGVDTPVTTPAAVSAPAHELQRLERVAGSGLVATGTTTVTSAATASSVAAVTPAGAPTSVAAPTDSGAPAPLQPVPFLVSALVAGALAAASSGRGPLAASAVLTTVRNALPTVSSERVREVLARAVPGPVLIPGTSPG